MPRSNYTIPAGLAHSLLLARESGAIDFHEAIDRAYKRGWSEGRLPMLRQWSEAYEQGYQTGYSEGFEQGELNMASEVGL